jgi:integrase
MTELEKSIYYCKKLRPRSKELYLQHVRAFLNFIGDATPTTDHVRAWRSDMQRRKVKPQSINVALNALNFAARRTRASFFTKDLFLPVSAKSKPKSPERTLTWAEGRRLVAACKGTRGRDIRDRAIITLGLRTGMLRFSMCQLAFADLREDRLKFVKKGGDTHTIYLDDVTRTALQDWIDWLGAHGVREGRIFRSLGRTRIDPDDFAIGNQLTPDGLYRVIRDRARDAGLDDLHPHVFHKTFIAWATKAGARPRQIAAVTGHSSDAAGDVSGVEAPPANMLLPAWSVSRLKKQE